jgi:hypothetical protein
MTPSVVERHFETRKANSWVILLSAMTAFVSLHLLGYRDATKLAVMAPFAALLIGNYVRSVRERHGDVAPEWLKGFARTRRERREFPTLPFETRFDAVGGALDLPERITTAAEASRQFGRRVCVIHFRAPGTDSAFLRSAAEFMAKQLRNSDFVEVVAGYEIVICLNMIRDLGEGQMIVGRLMSKLASSPIFAAPWKIGAAMYPMHGYTGEDLMNAARDHGREPYLRSLSMSAEN